MIISLNKNVKKYYFEMNVGETFMALSDKGCQELSRMCF